MAERKKFRPWTEDEDKILRDGINARKRFVDIMDDLPGRTKEGLRHRKIALGMLERSKPLTDLKWETADDAVMRRGAEEKWDQATFLAALPHRSKNAIYYRAQHLKLGPISVKYQEVRDAQILRERQRLNRPKQWDELMADWAERTCLTCGVTFMSWGKGNRMCADHRNMSMGMD